MENVAGGPSCLCFDPDLYQTLGFDPEAEAEFSGRRRQMQFQIDLHCRAGRDTDTPSLEQGNDNLIDFTEYSYRSCILNYICVDINLCGQKAKAIMC